MRAAKGNCPLRMKLADGTSANPKPARRLKLPLENKVIRFAGNGAEASEPGPDFLNRFRNFVRQLPFGTGSSGFDDAVSVRVGNVEAGFTQLLFEGFWIEFK